MIERKKFTARGANGVKLFEATACYTLGGMTFDDIRFYPYEGFRRVRVLGIEFYSAFVKSVGTALNHEKYPKLITGTELRSVFFQAAWDMVHIFEEVKGIEFVGEKKVDNDTFRSMFLHGNVEELPEYGKFCELFEKLAAGNDVRHCSVYKALREVAGLEEGQ